MDTAKVDYTSKENDAADYSELTNKNQVQLRNAIVHGMPNGRTAQQMEPSRTDLGHASTQPDQRESERAQGAQMMAQLDQHMNQTPRRLESTLNDEGNLLAGANEDYGDGEEGRALQLHSGKESLKGASKEEFMIGEREEDPGTQREQPSAYMNEEFGQAVEGVKLVGKAAARTERQMISADPRPGQQDGREHPDRQDDRNRSYTLAVDNGPGRGGDHSPSTIRHPQLSDSPGTKAHSVLRMFDQRSPQVGVDTQPDDLNRS